MTQVGSDFQQQVLEPLDKLDSDIDGLKHDVGGLQIGFSELKIEQEKTNIRLEASQKGSEQIVNLAFGLIAAATVTVIFAPALQALLPAIKELILSIAKSS